MTRTPQLLLAALIGAASCTGLLGPDDDLSAVTDAFIADGVEVGIRLDSATVRPPATLTASLLYTNLGDTAVTVTSAMSCRAFVGVYRGETRVSFPETDYACLAAVTSWTLPGGESLRDVWRLEIGEDATPLEAGSYRFVADLLTHDRVLEVPFTVR